MFEARRIRRFWAMVEKTDGCWLWKGRVERNGYARTLTGSGTSRKHWLCHRLSWTISYGPIPAGRDALHKCDVRRCVRPDHLFLGDQQANMDDMVAKGRSVRGECQRDAVLNPDAVRLVRFFRGIHSQQKIAAAVGVTQSVVSKIQRRALWAHVA